MPGGYTGATDSWKPDRRCTQRGFRRSDMNTSSPDNTRTLRLFLIRGVIAIAWAVVFMAVANSLTTGVTVVAGVLLVLYPLIDAVASLIDARSQHGSARRLLLVNAGFSIAAVCRTLTRVSTEKRTAAKSSRRYRWRRPHGRLQASWIGGSKRAGRAWSGSDGYEARTASSGGSKLVIFVPPAAHSHDRICDMTPARRE
jgi:hypothetical protein